MAGYYKEFENNGKGMSFKASDKKLFKKYINIWKKNSNLVDTELYNTTHFEDKEKGIRYIISEKALLMVK